MKGHLDGGMVFSLLLCVTREKAYKKCDRPALDKTIDDGSIFLRSKMVLHRQRLHAIYSQNSSRKWCPG